VNISVTLSNACEIRKVCRQHYTFSEYGKKVSQLSLALVDLASVGQVMILRMMQISTTAT